MENKKCRTWIATLNNPKDHGVESYEQYLKEWHTERGAEYVSG